MLYRHDARIGEDHIVIQVHVPRTSGSSQRTVFEQWFGHASCLMNYEGELASLSAEQRARYRLVSGHVAYGAHVLWDKTPVYITTVRHPVERFLSTYAAFLISHGNRGHRFVGDTDVNQFLRLGLASDDPFLSHQFRNMQCRLIGGEASFAVARQHIDQHYFLAAPFPEMGAMMALLSTACGGHPLMLPAVNDMRARMAPHRARASLTDESIDLLLQHEQQDLLLYSYVQKAFAALRAAAPCGPLFVPAAAQPLFPPDCKPGPDWLGERLRGMAARLTPDDLLEVQARIIPAGVSPAQLAPLAAPLWQLRLPDGSTGIACEEAPLLALAYRSGLEIHGQCKGAWLTADNALGQTDCLLLRKRRFGTIAEPPLRAAGSLGRCNICGGTRFGPGPHGRMAADGSAPCCLGCGSLERQRVTYRLLQALPVALLAGATALQIGKEILRPGLFGRLDSLEADGEALLRRLQQQPDGQYDFIILSTQLAQVADDRAALAHLRRMLAPQGMLVLSFGDFDGRARTLNYSQAQAPWGSWHAYGLDLASHFGMELDSALMLAVEASDPGTSVRSTVHTLFRSARQCSKFAAHLRAYDSGAIVSAQSDNG